MTDIEASPKRYDGIQALRALACLCVMVHHVTIYTVLVRGVDCIPFIIKLGSILGLGMTGVYIFFVISGYVVTLSMKQGRKFMLYRFLRIYPPYWGAVLLSFTSGLLFSMVWTFNFPSFLLLPGFKLNGTFRIPYWTLVYEMVFYAVIYACILAGLSRRRVLMTILLWVCTIVVYGIYKKEVIAITSPNWLILLSPINILFAVGVFLALAEQGLIDKLPTPLLIVIFLVSWSISFQFKASKVFYFLVIGVSYGSLLVVFKRLSVVTVIRKMGDASYGIYLIHMIVLSGVVVSVGTRAIALPFGLLWCVFMALALLIGLGYGLLEYGLYRRLIGRIKRGWDRTVLEAGPD